MKRKHLWWLFFIPVLVVYFFLQFDMAPNRNSFKNSIFNRLPDREQEKDIIPRLQTQTLSGEKFDLADHVGNSIIFIYFTEESLLSLSMSTNAIKKFAQLKEKFPDENFKSFLAVPYHPDWRKPLKRYRDQLEIEMPFILDPVETKKLSLNSYRSTDAFPLRRSVTAGVRPLFPTGFLVVVKPDGEYIVRTSRVQNVKYDLLPCLERFKTISPISREEYLKKLENSGNEDGNF